MTNIQPGQNRSIAEAYERADEMSTVERLEQTDYFPLNLIIVGGSLIGVIWFAIEKLWSLLV